MKYRVTFTANAERNLEELLLYIASSATPEIAERFIDSIVEQCEALVTYPIRGNARDDIRPGLRVLGFRRRVAIAFVVSEDQVTILGIFYGGRTLEHHSEELSE